MKTEEIVKLLMAAGAIKVTPAGKVTVDAGKVNGHWSNDGHGWRRDPGDGGGQGDSQEQDSDC